MMCCASCFGDRGLRRNIIPSLSTTVGACSYCESLNENIVKPSALAEVFGLLINIYEPDPGGRLLVEWLKSDWQLFDHQKLDVPAAKNLLADILDDGEIVRRTFSPSPRFRSETLNQWELLRTELMTANRYFPNAKIDLERFENLLGHLPADEMPDRWFRARVGNDEPFPIGNMGAPPARVASHGRANPPGIPYLYLGSTTTTAIAEIRPQTGELVCVADFALCSGLKMVDLRNPRKLVSPFLLSDESEIGSLRGDVVFLERLGEELTRPVLAQGAAIDYVPSQYLCEFIKKCGYSGVIYRSAVSDGMNTALFSSDCSTGISVRQYRVGRVTVDVIAQP